LATSRAFDTNRLAAIVDSSDDAIISKDLNGIVTSWNRGAERMFGYTAQEMIGRSIRTIIPADRQTEEDDVLSRIRNGIRVEHFETIRLRKDGTTIPISLSVSPVRDARGKIVGASKIARDISGLKQAQEQTAYAYEQMQIASRMKDEFLATLSHELRTPLNAIVGYARMLRSGTVPEERITQALEVIDRNATALTQIVEDVLDVSRIISGKVRLNLRQLEVSGVLMASIDTVRPGAETKGVELQSDVESVGRISGDPDRLQQVFWNLLSNAVKFTPRGGCVTVQLAQAGSNVDITVSDTGIGITPEFLPHIFERFRQAESGTTRRHGGLGLGLAIARNIVEMHGGTIEAESAGVGKGSTFRVSLPLVGIRSETVSDRYRDVLRLQNQPYDAEPAALAGVRILAVDDDQDALSMLRQVLESAGADVDTVGSAAQALEQLATEHPDLLIADLGMPQMDGFDLIEQVRRSADPAIRDLPAAALTAYARSEDRVKALRSGFGLHLSKPIDPAELVAAVDALMRRRALR
jgi:PAS domain S-box-containing protein